MPRIYRVFIHKDKKAVVTVDLDRGLVPLYYGAEDAGFAHSLLVGLCVFVLYLLLL